MQTNLHRVSEFAVTSNQTAGEEHEARTSVKRIREQDSDTESEVDDIVGSSTVPVALADLSNQRVEAADPWQDSSKSDAAQLDATVFLSFDWDNEGPYEKAVERYYSELSCSFCIISLFSVSHIIMLTFRRVPMWYYLPNKIYSCSIYCFKVFELTLFIVSLLIRLQLFGIFIMRV